MQKQFLSNLLAKLQIKKLSLQKQSQEQKKQPKNQLNNSEDRFGGSINFLNNDYIRTREKRATTTVVYCLVLSVVSLLLVFFTIFLVNNLNNTYEQLNKLKSTNEQYRSTRIYTLELNSITKNLSQVLGTKNSKQNNVDIILQNNVESVEISEVYIDKDVIRIKANSPDPIDIAIFFTNFITNEQVDSIKILTAEGTTNTKFDLELEVYLNE
jgi:hypothetical protein